MHMQGHIPANRSGWGKGFRLWVQLQSPTHGGSEGPGTGLPEGRGSCPHSPSGHSSTAMSSGVTSKSDQVLLGSGFSFHKSAGKRLVSGRVFGLTMLQGKAVESPSWGLGGGNIRPDLQNLQMFTPHSWEEVYESTCLFQGKPGILLASEADRGTSVPWTEASVQGLAARHVSSTLSAISRAVLRACHMLA